MLVNFGWGVSIWLVNNDRPSFFVTCKLIHRVSTTQSPSSSGVSWRFAEQFPSNPDSDIELADEEREERLDRSNIEPIFRDSSLSDLKDDNDVPSAENYPLGANNFLKNPWRMWVRAFQALPLTGTNGLQQDVVREGIPHDESDDRGNDGIKYLSLSLSLSIRNVQWK